MVVLGHYFNFRLIISFTHIISCNHCHNTVLYRNSRNFFRSIKIMNKQNSKLVHAALKNPHCTNGATSKSSLKTIPTIPAGEFEVLNSPIKSFSDKKQYRVIRLKNGLTACLICDTENDSDDTSGSESESGSENEIDSCNDNASSWETEKSSSAESDSDTSSNGSKNDEVKLAAAALCVGVGSFSDPKDVPGLAHFLEHMVFMGSEKFPQENDFDAFIKKHGGSDNGSTDSEITTFYFECFEKHLLEALDKFSQFFISPLMKRDSLSRERESVESEFQMAAPSDDNRVEQLLMSLALSSSPVNGFSWGNLVSLRDNITEDDLYEKLHEFRKRHYSSHRMTVAIQARLPLDVLENYVVTSFSKVPNNNLPPDNFSMYTDNVFDTPQFAKLYYVKPVKHLCQVILTWVMPSLVHMYKSKPHDYVAWLLGHQGQGSLLSYLKKQLWAFSLDADTGSSYGDFNSLYTSFTITIYLSEKGYQNLDRVIEGVFSYIKLLNNVGPSEAIFKEIQTIQEISFRFDEEENPCEIVENLVENMQVYPPEDYLIGSELYFEYSPEEIKKVLAFLIPTKMNVMVLSSNIADSVNYDQIEPWFKVHYKAQEFPPEWLGMWQSTSPLACLKLPVPNEFLTVDFTMLPEEKNVPKYPQKIMDTPSIELWYKKDQKFGLPVAYYYYYLFSPLSAATIQNTCMMHIFVLILNMNLIEEGYPAKLADLTYDISSYERGILIKVVGYNEKLPKLIQLIAKYLKNCANSFDEVLFETAKSKQQQNEHNILLKPSKLCNDLRSSILQKHYISLLEKYLTYPDITYTMMKKFSENVFNCLYVQGLVQGNLTSTKALESTQILLDELSFKPLPSTECLMMPVNEIPKGEHCCRVLSLDEGNINSIVTNYYQCGPLTIKDNVILEYIMILTEEPLFDNLRTKEQLGYSVSSTIRDTYGILGYSITVQSQADKFTTKHIDNRIENFIKYSQKLLKKMKTKEFNETKLALTEMKQVADVDLEDEVDRNWDEIIYRKYMFDRLQKEITAIRDLKSLDIVKWWDRHNICSKKNNCRKLSVQVVGHIKSASGEEVVQLEVVNLPAGMNLKRAAEVQDYSKLQVTSNNILVPRDNFEVILAEEMPVMITDVLSQWNAANRKLSLHFVDDETEVLEQNKAKDYFIKNIKSFKRDLKTFSPVTTLVVVPINTSK